ncbi:hypothetical protein [Enterococcus sp. UD-01]|jgi:hypothetical protein|uniref:hypothetical protein n=1 Tax=Enterococcus sp. UD-01 TaxID=3373911 RepID=UPI003834D08A
MKEVLNTKMHMVARNAKLSENNHITFSLNKLDQFFNIKIQSIFDCILIVDDEEIVLDKEQFTEVIKMYGDKTGYEASNNELRIIDYIDDRNISKESQYLLGKSFIKNLSNRISKKIVSYFSFDDELLTIRFHIFREKDGLWLNEDLEQFEEATGYFISD